MGGELMVTHSVHGRNDGPGSGSRRGPVARRRPLFLIVTIAVTTAFVGSLAPVALASSPGHGPKPPEAPGRRYNVAPAAPGTDSLWGLAVSNSAVDPDALQEAMGRTFQAQGVYTPLTGWNYPIASAQTTKDNGGRIYLNINSWHVVSGKKVCYRYANYTSHAYDAYLQKWVNDLQAFDYDNTAITFTHEPTASSASQPSCGTAAEYVVAFDYVFHYFRDHGISYPFIWWMVASSFLNHYAHNWQPPADDFSVVAVDGYNRFLDGNWRSPSFMFQPVEDYATSIGKPLVIGEIGTMEDPARPTRKADWITTASELFRVWGVDAILWNDTEGYRPDSSAASLAAWVSAAEDSGSAFIANVAGHPGDTVTTWGAGFTPGEWVDVRRDSVSGGLLGSEQADSSGAINPVTVHIPSVIAGGTHPLFAIGRSSGTVAQGTLSISPPQPPAFAIAAGQVYTYAGVGFVPGENVSVSFPGGSLQEATAGPNGSVTIPVTSPPEPNTGGVVSVSSPSDSLSITFHVIAVVSAPDEAQPQDSVHVSVTGYGASESVAVKIGTQVLGTLSTNASGSASGNVVLDTTFGRHTLTFTGASSKVSKPTSILLRATLALSPDSGPTGTSVDVTSGPGWVPGETIDVKVGGASFGTVTADSNGEVDTSVTIGKKTPGPVHITLYGRTLKLTAGYDFTVT
jgi:hypothetical protein